LPAPDTEARVVCATPRGRIYVAVSRDTLLRLDVSQPDQRVRIPGLEVDLYWAACAVQ
jgi:hypothetical protein